MKELGTWIDGQARREAGVVRLEDALLANRFASYFFYRLRYLLARTAISTVIHAFKIILLLGVFPRSEFILIVIVQGSVALLADFWWGALEELRTQIRTLQRRQSRHRIAPEIGRWLTLSSRSAVVIAVAAFVYGLVRLVTGAFGPVDGIVFALLIGAALGLVAQTYHSGAYAFRRVYRPLPSLLALDFVSVGLLLGLYPFIGIWAFPVAELTSVLVVVAISLWYTTRTYRTLALPTLAPLLRLNMPIPRWRHLRSASVPGISYALVGLEALVVIAGIATATTAAGATLVVLLAALAPLTRASFEWARLLYFDLKRIDVPLLSSLRRRFDRAIVKLSLLIGASAGLLAAVVAVFVVDAFTPLLIVALVALFTVRSVLAAAQMQAFTRTAYLRLSIAGFAGVAGVIACFALPTSADVRLLAVAGVLGASLVLLVSLPHSRGYDDGVISFSDWLLRLRRTTQPVTVTRLRFDNRRSSRGTTAEARRAEAWRQRNVAYRMGSALIRRGGAATWVAPTVLWTFDPRGSATTKPEQLVTASAGLIDSRPEATDWPDPAAAALALAEEGLGFEPGGGPSQLPSIAELVDDFGRRFPTGIAYNTSATPPVALTQMASYTRVDIYRAAMLFARGAARGRGPDAWDVSALVENSALRALFAVDRKLDAAARREWSDAVRAWSVRAAAGVPVSSAAPRQDPAPNDKDATAQEAAML